MSEMENPEIPKATEIIVSAEDAALLKDAGIENQFVPPTRDQMKEALRDPSTPDPVKRHLRAQLYGEGNGGRKEAQQQRLRRESSQLQKGQHRTDGIKFPPGTSGRQKKRIRRLLRQGIKAVQTAT